jgi:hypothetical protein
MPGKKADRKYFIDGDFGETNDDGNEQVSDPYCTMYF